ncbi:MAG TPA: cellulase family glycosylhydrolase [Bacteroidota bacterium]|nr:cellulase family glycosylhydrolase [Bacteroidota bacterium]
MKRRDFIKTTGGVIAAASLAPATLGAWPLSSASRRSDVNDSEAKKYSRYRGFNLTEKTGAGGPRRRFNEEDFQIIAEWGMNFARLPMSYWNWSQPNDWLTIDEDVMSDIDEAVEFGRQYNIHINLNMHRVPGYCINGRDQEPMDLFDDTPERMQRALDALVFHWKYFARRYKGIPSSRVSFDLINEPPKNTNELRYEQIVRAVVAAIREEDPERLIAVDGKDIGRNPMLSIADLGVVQSTRGYDPMAVSHYTATWVPDDEKETFAFPTWPLRADNGKLWDKEALREKLIDRWQPLIDRGVQVHVGEWGCYNQTPHDVTLAWMRDLLSLWKDAGWGQAMWNLKGDFGVINSRRKDVQYETFQGHKLDRKMLELLKEY